MWCGFFLSNSEQRSLFLLDSEVFYACSQQATTLPVLQPSQLQELQELGAGNENGERVLWSFVNFQKAKAFLKEPTRATGRAAEQMSARHLVGQCRFDKGKTMSVLSECFYRLNFSSNAINASGKS